MGRVKELIIELAETFEDLRPSRGTWHAAIDAMKEILSPDEFEFFLDNIDEVKTIIGMHNDAYPTNEARGGEKEMIIFITDYIQKLAAAGHSTEDIEFSLEDDLPAPAWHFYRENADLIWQIVTDEIGPLSEARGDDEYYDQYELGPGDGAITNLVKRDEIEWPVENRDEEDWDEDDDVPYPGGMTQDDYDEEREPGKRYLEDYEDEYEFPDPTDYMKKRMGDNSYEDEFEKTGETDYMRRRANESLLMPSLNEYWDDDDDDEDMWVTINGKRVHKNSREYRKWYEEEGEFDDTEGRAYRRNRY